MRTVEEYFTAVRQLLESVSDVHVERYDDVHAEQWQEDSKSNGCHDGDRIGSVGGECLAKIVIAFELSDAFDQRQISREKEIYEESINHETNRDSVFRRVGLVG